MYFEDTFDLEAERNPNPGRYVPDPRKMSDAEFFRYAQEMDELEKEHRETIDSAIKATLPI